MIKLHLNSYLVNATGWYWKPTWLIVSHGRRVLLKSIVGYFSAGQLQPNPLHAREGA